MSYWVETPFERFPVPYSHEPYAGEYCKRKFTDELNAEERAAQEANRRWWQLGHDQGLGRQS